jgi:peptide/nickel transport system substrate-binding protein
VASNRKGEYIDVEAVQAPDPYTVVFKLKYPSASFLNSLASPWNWIYKADILAKDPRWYESNVMGTGPFLFVEHVKGSHWVGKKNPNYWDKGKPYLDGYRAIFITDSAAQVAAIRGERAMIQFRGFSPAERDSLVQALGKKITVQESRGTASSSWPESRQKAVRRQAVSPGADAGPRPLPGLAGALQDCHRQGGRGGPGAGHPVRHARRGAREARRLRTRHRQESSRRQAPAEGGGVPDGFSFVYKNRGIPMPYEPISVWLIDQWRQIGLNVRQEVIEPAKYYSELRGATSTLRPISSAATPSTPTRLYKFESHEKSPSNYSRTTMHPRRALREARAPPKREERKK